VTKGKENSERMMRIFSEEAIISSQSSKREWVDFSEKEK
jgi:hypothetical protein